MSVDLRNPNGDEFSFSTIGWAFYLNLAAVIYGWQKTGTLPPAEWNSSDGPWQGAYDWNAGQRVPSHDALDFAAALEKYLNDPDGKVRARELATGLSEAIGHTITANEDDEKDIWSWRWS